ncbi:MAG: hypothetical protein ACLGHP_06775 [Vicinamibacteria bacterium]
MRRVARREARGLAGAVAAGGEDRETRAIRCDRFGQQTRECEIDDAGGGGTDGGHARGAGVG